MSYHAYMIKSESTERYYYGHTSDLDERLMSHNSKKSGRIPFMWLAGGQRPNFRTINLFRKQRLPDGGIKGVFTCVMEMGLVDLSDYTVDGTTPQANARRHSAVWKSNSERYKQSAIERIEDYFDQIQQLADLEEADWQDRQAPEKADEPAWTAEQVRQTADRFDQALTALEQQADKDGGEPSGEDDRKRDWKAIEI